jgi:hypothetical protein
VPMPSLSDLPGLAGRAPRHAVLRWSGLVLGVVGVVLMGVALADLYGAFDRPMSVVPVDGLPGEVEVDDGPTLFWLALVGLPLACLGAALVALGYEALALEEESARPPRANGPFCRACGTRNQPDARFCDACGEGLA